MTAIFIAFPRRCILPTAAIEEEIERLIGMLDDREAASVDLEPDADLEESGDVETETWAEWRPMNVVAIPSRPVRLRGTEK